MSAPAATSARPADRVTSPALRLLRVFAVLSVLSVGFQFVTAGQLFSEGASEELHAGGAVVLHVLSGVAAAAAVWLWRQAHAGLAPAVLAVLVFASTFVQAATGGWSSLWVHVPGAMVVTLGAVWLAAWAFTGGARALSQRS